MNVNLLISITLLIGGIFLIIFGIIAAESFSSDISTIFTGTPADKTIWMFVDGIVLVLVGAFGALSGGKHRFERQ